jgi:hypothetical protein
VRARPNAVRHDWPRRASTADLEDLLAPPIRTGSADAAAPDSLERLEDLMGHLAGPGVRLP